MKIGFINQNVSPRLNMGLAYIMTMAATKHEVFLWDIVGHYHDFLEYLLNGIRKNNPGIIAFSVNSYTFRSAACWAKIIKENFPEITLLFGGVYPTVQPMECIEHSFVDMICVGEGEETVLECLERLEKNSLPYDVKGIYFKDNKRRIIKNELRPFVEDLDALPFPDWDLWDIDLYINRGGFFRNSLKVMSSRGCFHNCRFCTGPVIKKSIPGRYYRLRSPQNVIAEIKRNVEKYYDRGLRYTNFADPLFGADQKHFEKLMHLYKQEGLAELLPWACETHVEIITERWAQKAAQSSCMFISLGVESADDSLRKDTLGKHLEAQQITRAVSCLEKNNIMYIFYLMLGMPGETLRSAINTVRLALYYNPVKTYFLFFLPLPRTPLCDEYQGSTIKHRDTKYDDGYWNRPNIKLDKIPAWKYWYVHIFIFMTKTRLFFFKGLRLRGLTFIKDIFFSFFGRNRLLSSSNPYGVNEVYQNTILKYYFEDFYKRHRKKKEAVKIIK